MSEIAEELRAAGIFDHHGLLNSGEPCIRYRRSESRSPTPSGWYLWLKDKQIPDRPWFEYGGRTFSPIEYAYPVASAKEFARQITGVSEWEKSPFDNRSRYPTWVPKGTTQRALDKITEDPS